MLRILKWLFFILTGIVVFLYSVHFGVMLYYKTFPLVIEEKDMSFIKTEYNNREKIGKHYKLKYSVGQAKVNFGTKEVPNKIVVQGNIKGNVAGKGAFAKLNKDFNADIKFAFLPTIKRDRITLSNIELIDLTLYKKDGSKAFNLNESEFIKKAIMGEPAVLFRDIFREIGVYHFDKSSVKHFILRHFTSNKCVKIEESKMIIDYCIDLGLFRVMGRSLNEHTGRQVVNADKLP